MEKYVAAVQMDCEVGNMEVNTKNAIRLLKNLMKKEPKVVLAVFPEMALYGYDELDQLSGRCSEEEIDYCLQLISDTCKMYQIDVVIGAPFYGEAGMENALYYLSKQGTVQHVYSKMHLIQSEKEVFQYGKEYGTCQTSLGKIGFLICWDTAFPEPARIYREAGVDLLIVSAAWEVPYEEQWELAVRGRSFDNSIPTIAANRIGTDGNVRFFGRSMVINSMGSILAEEKREQEGYILVEQSKLIDQSKRAVFGSQIEELREETYYIDHVCSYEME